MELVLDANILIAALLKEGITRKLLFNDELILYTPEFIIEEFFKHITQLAKKAQTTEQSLHNLVKELIIESTITIITKDDLRSYIKKAEAISPDPDDVMYFATALKYKCSIWSNDKRLKNQQVIRIYTTHDLLSRFT
ncbi:MAG: PIN domain-containing protein [Methanobacteriota archaeon]